MFKRINNLHLSILVGIVSIFSLVLIQQYVEAQSWVPPSDLPGQTPDNTFVLNPLTDDLDIGTNDKNIAGDNVILDGGGAGAALTVSGNRQICFNGSCLTAWPSVSGGIVGSGTAGRIPKFTNNNTIGDSMMYQTVDGTTDTIWMGARTSGLATAQLRIETMSTNGGKPVLTLANNFGGSKMLYIDDRGDGNSIDILKANSSVTGKGLYIKNRGTGYSIHVDDYDSTSNDTTPFVLNADGNLGIGTSAPNKQLHVMAPTGNAEIDIQSGGVAGDLSHWGIYHNNPTAPVNADNLVFWKNSANRVMFTSTGNILLGGQICDLNGANCFNGASVGANYWTEDASSNLSRPESKVYLVENTQGLPAVATGAGTRMVWYPSKNAFRVGQVTGTQWDEASIGTDSVAFGEDSIASGNYSVVAGGRINTAAGAESFIGGGLTNQIFASNGLEAFIGGGYDNKIGQTGNAVQAAIVAGGSNSIIGNASFIGAGVSNVITGAQSVIVGGTDNIVNSDDSFIGGGDYNLINGSWFSAIVGGENNTVGGQYSIIGGGSNNSVAGKYASVIGGTYNKADGDSSFAGGQGMQISATGDNTFVWGSTATSSPFSITRDNTFTIFPTNPSSGSVPRVGIGTASPNKTLHVKSTLENAEIDIQSGSSPYWGIYQDDTTDELRLWHNGANKVVFSSRGMGVVSNATDGVDNYIQLDSYNGIPPVTDCDEASEEGRMFWKGGDFDRLLICGGTTGWKTFLGS